MATATPGAAADTAVSLVIQTRVAPGHDAEFTHWQQQLNDAVARFPGFVEQSMIPPQPPSQVDWVIVQRFTNAAAARAWLQSDERLKLLQAIQPVLLGQDDVHLFTDGGPKLAAPVTAIISMRVQPGKEAAFIDWQHRIAASEATFPGFSGYRLEPPVPGVQEDWTTMIRFDSDAHLDAWLNSPERERLLAEAPQFSAEFHTRKVHTGFDSWFATGSGASAPPPGWKQNMIVLLILYPTVFLFGFFVQDPLLRRAGVPFWLSLFFANAVSTVLLGYWFVPWASRALNWWLRPAPADAASATWRGVALIAALYALCLLAFSLFPPALIP
jgi:antibiotic biosynthesis monooxygenase (ABM) superfamily enzyme